MSLSRAQDNNKANLHDCLLPSLQWAPKSPKQEEEEERINVSPEEKLSQHRKFIKHKHRTWIHWQINKN